MRRFQFVFLAVLITLFPTQPLQAEPIRVGIYQNAPKLFLDNAGKARGFFVDVLEAVANQEQWQLSYVACEWNACLEGLASGEIDLMPDVAYSTSRAEQFDFGKETVLSNWSLIYAAEPDLIHSILDLHRRRISVVRGSIQFEALRTQAARYDIRPEFVEVDGFSQALDLLGQGRVDGALVNRLFGAAHEGRYTIYRTNVLVRPSRLHFAVRQGTHAELLTAIDRELQSMKAHHDSAYHRALDQWINPEAQHAMPPWLYPVLVAIVVLLMALMLYVVRQRRRLQAQRHYLDSTEERYRDLVEATPDLIWEIDAQGLYTYLSPNCDTVLGYSAGELIGQTLIGLDGPEGDDDRDGFQRILGAGEAFAGWNRRVRKRSGEIIYVETNGLPMRDPGGNLIGLRGVDRDVTASRMLMEDQAHHQAFLLGVIDAIPDLIWLKDTEGVYLTCNPEFERFFGARRAEIVGKTDYDFVDAELADFFRQNDKLAMEADAPRHNEEWITYANDGHRALLDTTKMPLRDGYGRVIGVLGIGHDVTDLREAEMAAGERLKELACLYSINSDLIEGVSVDELCKRAAGYLSQGLRYPEKAAVRIRCAEGEFTFGDIEARVGDGLSAVLSIDDQREGSVCVYYTDDQEFLEPFETNLVTGVAELLNTGIMRFRSREKARLRLQELTRWENLTLGREARIIELKAEVNHARRAQGLSPKYEQHDE